MDQLNTTTEHQKGKHLTFEERVIIQTRLKDQCSYRKIADEIGCSPNTVRNEIKRGTVSLYNNHVQRYKATVGQAVYDENRKACGRHYDVLVKSRFISYVEEHFFNDGWSLDVCYGRALETEMFQRNEVVCSKTLYHYVDKQLIRIHNHHLPEKLSRQERVTHSRENKRILGRSIEERPAEVEERIEFGHWEADLVIGAKTKDDAALLTMLERKSRQYWAIPIAGKEAVDVMQAFQQIQSEYSEHFDEVFKTITTDNGSEFAELSHLEEVSKVLVFYAHPYSSYEKGSNERHNRLLRRFIPKGRRIDEYSFEQIADIETWCNTLPRKILGYRTPDEIFDAELDLIYAMPAI